MDILKFRNILLSNFRCFAECLIELHPQLTVLVADNGHGKSAVLDALVLALSPFVDAMTEGERSTGFEPSDIRLVPDGAGGMTPSLPTRIEADAIVNGRPLEWARSVETFNTPRPRTSSREARELVAAASDMKMMALGEDASQPQALPLIAQYGTGRLWNQRPPESKYRSSRSMRDRTAGYANCFSSSSSFDDMIAWFDARMDQAGDPHFSGEWRRNVSLFNAVREAVRVVLQPTGWCELEWDKESRGFVVGNQRYGRLPLASLSDGVRNMIALVADIARRCAMLNPQFGENAAHRTPGVLLIDEVDMHLHPRWQQLVVASLQKAFPRVQLVLTTHSPHVLSTVDWDSIRVISQGEDDNEVEKPPLQTQGVESAGVLSSVMDVDAVPPVKQAAWLSDYRALLQTSNAQSARAKDLWKNLVLHFGEKHPVLEELRVLRRLQDFRRENNLGPSRRK